MDEAARPSRALVVVTSLFHVLWLLPHAAAAVAVLELLPRGFPLSHPRFFANLLFPSALLATSLATGVLLRVRPRTATCWLAAFPAAWLGAALSTALSFPISGGLVVRCAAAAALVLGLAWLFWFRSFRPTRARLLLLTLTLGSGLGVLLPLTQRAPAPTTRPSPPEPALLVPTGELGAHEATLALTPSVRVVFEPGEVEASLRDLRLSVRPLLEFESRSPDGFWTLFSAQWPEHRFLVSRGRRDSLLELRYEPEQRLRVEALATGGLLIDATTHVARDVFSHLNSFTSVLVTGHRRLGLRFSACPSAITEVTHADYPVGAPASFAYLDEHGTFRVVRATSAEKGPFTTLASGPLARGASLGISFVELSETPPRVLAEVHFDDWTQQLSTELSPTAGFGVAQNAIQFGLGATESASQAYLVLNLAGTSIGRGWDSVGHRAGHYRNRIRIDRAPSEP